MIRFASAARSARRSLLVLALCSPALGQSRAPAPEPCALLHVRLFGAPDEAPLKTILLRDGRIESVQNDGGQVPGSYRSIDGTGLIAAPAFLDAFTQRGVVAPEIEVDRDRPVDTGGSVLTDMRAARRKGIRPTFRAADGLKLTDEAAEAMRKAGFGAQLAAPAKEMIAGHSAVALARNAAARDQVIRASVFQHAAFNASGSGYPSTLMGYMAALRQVFLDSQHHAGLSARRAAGESGPRPPYDPDLDALLPVLEGKQMLVCEAETDRDVRRWLRLADEFGLRTTIAGGRDAWQAADRLLAAKVPVVLTLNWGDEVKDPEADKDEEPEGEAAEGDAGDGEAEPATDGPEAPEGADEPADADAEAEGAEADGTTESEPAALPLDFDYAEPMAVQLEKRAEWLRRRDCAMRLAEAGVPFVFGSGGESSKDLLKKVRTLVAEGLPKTQAIAALTSASAAWMGVEDELGSLEPGRSATLCLWTADPLEDKSEVRWAFVDGYHYEYEAKQIGDGEGPADGVDLTGTWTVKDPDSDADESMTFVLEMDKEGAVTGEVKTANPMDGSPLESSVTGTVSGKEFEMEMTFAVDSMQVDVKLKGKWAQGKLKGTRTLRFGGQEQETKFEGTQPDGGVNQEVQR